jgi:hypothetical protein
MPPLGANFTSWYQLYPLGTNVYPKGRTLDVKTGLWTVAVEEQAFTVWKRGEKEENGQ